ncbi:MAG: transposase IS200 [Mycoplasmataceae bacterium RC_NB112A]|nr:MAG: transposase IS200 [Mycoplasmataceae bacterium RC_NB112A]KLL01799.1 MAG: transposase IS200 [Mycoplasmataceae bacterium RC_NB112A]
MVNMLELDNNNHSVFLLVIKYRRKVLDNPISQRLKEIFEYIAKGYNVYLQEWNHDQDHIHCLFKAHPNSELSKFINAYKSASSRLIKKKYLPIKTKLWKEFFWSWSFCLLTTGEAPIETIKEYIRNQGEIKNHEKKL